MVRARAVQIGHFTSRAITLVEEADPGRKMVHGNASQDEGGSGRLKNIAWALQVQAALAATIWRMGEDESHLGFCG